jgi:hypothetical protein
MYDMTGNMNDVLLIRETFILKRWLCNKCGAYGRPPAPPGRRASVGVKLQIAFRYLWTLVDTKMNLYMRSRFRES